MRKEREVDYDKIVSNHPVRMRADMKHHLKKGDQIITEMLTDCFRKFDKSRKG